MALFDVFKADDVLQLADYDKNREMDDYLTSDEFHRDYPIYLETVLFIYLLGRTLPEGEPGKYSLYIFPGRAMRKYLQAKRMNA